MFSGIDLHHTNPAQHLITTGRDSDDLDRHLSDELCMHSLSSPTRVKLFISTLTTTSAAKRLRGQNTNLLLEGKVPLVEPAAVSGGSRRFARLRDDHLASGHRGG